MITDEVYVEIELLRKHGMSLRKIAEAVGCAVNTVRSHLAADSLPRYPRSKVRVTKLSPFHNYLRERQAAWFDDEMDKLDNWAEDKRAGLKADLSELDDQIKTLKKEIRQTGNLPDKLALQKKMRPLEQKRDDAWRAYDAAAKEIEIQKDMLLDQVEARLGQQVTKEELFTIRFRIN